MATTPNSVITPQGILNSAIQFTSTNGATPQDLWVASSNGAILNAICVTGTHTTARLLTLKFYDGTNSRVIGAISIPGTSGTTNANPAIAPMNHINFPFFPKDINGNSYLMLQNGQKITAVLDNNTDGGTVLEVSAFGQSY